MYFQFQIGGPFDLWKMAIILQRKDNFNRNIFSKLFFPLMKNSRSQILIIVLLNILILR